jgi:hypothetical protein
MKPRYWIYLAVVFWLVEIWYFGWNTEPSCTAEKICDGVAVGLWLIGAVEWFIARIAEAVVDKLKEAEE